MINRTIKNLRRTREIIGILLKYGFEEIVSETSLKHLVSEKRRARWSREDRSVLEYSRWERVRMAFEELGPTFIKFAQVLSNRPDLLPNELIAEFEKLQSSVPPFDAMEARAIIERELKAPIHDIFSQFEDVPIGSASIGQVHKATLKEGIKGETAVVVKVQRPDVQRQIETDLEILKFIVIRTEDFLEKNGMTNAMDVVLAFERTMQKELDYTNEARNIEQFRTYYKDETDFYVPKAYKTLTTQKVMVIERVDGCKISDTVKLKEWGIDPTSVAETGMRIYISQIFEHGYFHADPHPGNVLVRPDGTICLIDFGMVGSLMQADKQNFAGIFISMARKDARAMASYLRRLAVDDEIKDIRQLEYDLNDIIEDFASLDVSESSMASLGVRLQKVIYENRLRVPGGIFLILRALAMLEGIGKIIAPDFQTMEYIKPYGVKLVADRFSPSKLLPELWNDLSEFMILFKSIPIEGREILKQARKGRLKFQLEHHGYEPLMDTLNRTANHLGMALIVASMFLSGSLVLFSNLPKNTFGIPLLSFVFYLLASLLAIRLWRVARRL